MPVVLSGLGVEPGDLMFSYSFGAVVIGFVPNRWVRTFFVAILAFVTLYAISLTNKISTEPERTYAYFVVPPPDSQTL